MAVLGMVYLRDEVWDVCIGLTYLEVKRNDGFITHGALLRASLFDIVMYPSPTKRRQVNLWAQRQQTLNILPFIHRHIHIQCTNSNGKGRAKIMPMFSASTVHVEWLLVIASLSLR
jgi:hypothetical protein